jgi:hypothetical protein
MSASFRTAPQRIGGFPTAACFFFLLSSLSVLPAAEPRPLSFNRDVRPILSDNCFHCHGPDAANRKGHRRLDTFDGAIAERNGIRAIVPGDPAASELLLRIASPHADEVMPPPEAHKTLTADQKETLRRWIAEGARYERHWAYEPLRPIAPPAVKNEAWVRNPIDRFILARLEKENLAPSSPADPATLLRRLSFDLTGLPPAPESVRAFRLSALDSQLSALLSSPHYGERMAADWLDAARYADTNGYQVDRDRELHAWRDWVIRAFNENKPFDQFTVEQLAGDLLPDATLEQKIATGFNRNHILNEEGGVIADEFLAEATADRVETVATVWLAQTFNCTRCHDHKFDPFTQRDFYSLKAFFNNVPETGKGTYDTSIRRNAPPMLRLPAPAAEAELTRLERERAAVRAQLPALAAAQTAAEIDAWAQRLAAGSAAWTPAEIVRATAPNLMFPIDASRRRVQVHALEARLSRIALRVQAPLRRATAVRLRATGIGEATVFSLAAVSAAPIENNQAARRALPLRAAAADGSLPLAETALLADQDRETRVPLAAATDRAAEIVFEIDGGLAAAGDGPLDFQIALEGGESAGPVAWEIEVTDADPALLAPPALVASAARAPATRSAAERDALRAHRALQLPAHRALADRIAALTRDIARTEDAIPTTLVMAERAEPRATHILRRGAYDQPGEQVFPATPAILPPMDAAWPRNRLGLARWLVSAENPLTARVTVNRLWQLVFGTGLVNTAGDFGSQGEWPSHPELLDWLAQELIRSGWDMKALLRLLVTSATYQQSSRFTPELLSRDPENRLLARASRFRLPAEAVRDSALAASGLLVPTLGGPSVKPYHPPGLYEQVTSGTGTTVYTAGTGADLHRRTLYTYWKRSVPHPALLAFDVPFRETCTVQRVRTNTPLQALNLMNDPTYVEAARALAQRMMRNGGAAPAARLAHGFHLVLARAPQPGELAILVAAQARSQGAFQADPAAAAAYLRVGATPPDTSFDPAELASYATVAGTILCMDEAVSRN